MFKDSYISSEAIYIERIGRNDTRMWSLHSGKVPLPTFVDKRWGDSRELYGRNLIELKQK